MSTNPGVTTRPSASISRRPRSGTSPTAVMRSPSTATSATRPGAPEPSTTKPLRMTRSCTASPRRSADTSAPANHPRPGATTGRCLPAPGGLLGPAEEAVDGERLAAVRHDRAAPGAEALVDRLGEHAERQPRPLVVDRGEGEVDLVGARRADPPGAQPVGGVVGPDEVLGHLRQPPVDAEGVLGHAGAVGPLAADLDADRDRPVRALDDAGAGAPVPAGAVGPAAAAEVEAAPRAPVGGQLVAAVAPGDDALGRACDVLVRVLVAALTPGDDDAERLVALGPAHEDVGLERLGAVDGDPQPGPVVHLDHRQLEAPGGEADRRAADHVGQGDAPGQRDRHRPGHRGTGVEVVEPDVRDAEVVDVGADDVERAAGTGDAPEVPPLAPLPPAREAAVVQRGARPADGVGVQPAVGQAEGDGFGQLALVVGAAVRSPGVGHAGDVRAPPARGPTRRPVRSDHGSCGTRGATRQIPVVTTSATATATGAGTSPSSPAHRSAA